MSTCNYWETVSIRPFRAPGSPRGPRISDALAFRLQVNGHTLISAGKRVRQPAELVYRETGELIQTAGAPDGAPGRVTKLSLSRN